MRIICCGNPDRGDDGVGALVAKRLRDLDIIAEIRSGEALDLIGTWCGADHVVVVDAVETGASLGTVWLWDGREVTFPTDQSASTHGLGVSSAIRLARVLGRLPERLQVYGIEARRFEHGTEVSAELKLAVEHVVQQIDAAYRLSWSSSSDCHFGIAKSSIGINIGAQRRRRGVKIHRKGTWFAEQRSGLIDGRPVANPRA